MRQDKVTTKDVLKILTVGAIIISAPFLPGLPQAVNQLAKQWKNTTRADLGRIVKRLEKQEMISISESGNRVKISLTEKGSKRLLEYDFENIKLKAKKRDGQWRLILFDIPEKKKNSRDVFRRKLIQLGFIRMQDSVFVSAFPCKEEIDFLCHFLGISNFVSIVSLNKIERGEELIFQSFNQYN